MNLKMFSKVFLIFFIAAGLQAQNNKSVHVKVKKTTDFEVLGNGSASEWQKTDWIKLPQRKPDTQGYETKAKVLYSETGIYFLFDCQDQQLNSTFKKDNENLWEEDVVEVFLWTDETFPLYFEYELSPLNYELPIIIPNSKGKFFGWLPWHYEGERKTRHATSVRGGETTSGATISGWMAEVFIPYKLLAPLQNVPPKSGTKWRANMYRIDHDHGQALFSWQEIEKSFHEYENFGTFIFE